MLRYIEAEISTLEVPGETSLCIYISGCIHKCAGCHYPELQRTDYGIPLRDGLPLLIQIYGNRVSCVCFLGDGSPKDREELVGYAETVHAMGLSSCLYSGQSKFEEWMAVFDYVKVGPYVESLGPLTMKGTNQKMYCRTAEGIFKYVKILLLA